MLYLWGLVLLAFLGTIGWRILGVAVGGRLNPESGFFVWVNAVAYAMVSGVMMLLVMFPRGAAASTLLEARLAGLAIALGVMLWRRNMVMAVIAGLGGYAIVTWIAG